MAESPRIEELRRRVAHDPASIAFAQLAEEYRRAGDYEQAVQVCRTGLAQHPNYLSARVTLGRALLELQHYDDAKTELDLVLQSAPDNLAAIRALAEIHQRRGEIDEAPKPGPDDAVVTAVEPGPPSPPPDYTRALAALDAITVEHSTPSIAHPDDEALGELESWLDAIIADRHSRA